MFFRIGTNYAHAFMAYRNYGVVPPYDGDLDLEAEQRADAAAASSVEIAKEWELSHRRPPKKRSIYARLRLFFRSFLWRWLMN